MIGVVSAVVLLVYLGRVLAWAWGPKPLEAGDVVLLLPIVVVAILIRKRALRPRLRQPPAAAEIDGGDESQVVQIERSREARTGESENLRRQQEWEAADYHWWKR